MEEIWQWGIDLIHTIQIVHGPALDMFFKIITSLGEEEFFLMLIPLFFWCVDLTSGARLAFIFLLSAYVNTGFKDILAHPRPFELDPTVKLHEADGYGLPSGHSQSAVVVWGTIAAEFRKKWIWVVVILLMGLIGFSRIYLGVHFPTDVFGGWTVGVIALAIYLTAGPRIELGLKQMGLTGQLVLSIVVPLTLLLLHPTKGTASPMAALMGMGIGIALTRKIAPFSAAGPPRQRVARFLVGMVGTGIFYFGLSAVFPGEGEPLYFIMRVVRYVLVGLWVAFGAPWLFLRLRLASSE